MIIENCCCHNQLPTLAPLSLKRDRVVTYHTNGDVTLERVLFSVASLVGRCTLTIVIPKLDIHILRYLRHGIERDWWTHISILTSVGQTALIEQELPKRNIKVVEDKRIYGTSQMLVMDGVSRRLCITGYHPVVSPTDNGQPYRLCQHQFYMEQKGSADSGLWDELTKIPLTPLRVRK